MISINRHNTHPSNTAKPSSFFVMATIFGSIQSETPSFKLLRSTAFYEIRRYAPQLRCTVFTGNRTNSLSSGEGFRDLAGYIFGDNKMNGDKAETIAMTAPVVTQNVSANEKIAMTAPVITQKPSDEGSQAQLYMSFVLPSKYQRLDQLPRPNNPQVKLEEIPAKTVAVHRFSGMTGDEAVQQKFQELKHHLAQDKIKVTPNSPEILARYNPPWTIPFLRTNEVQLEIEFDGE